MTTATTTKHTPPPWISQGRKPGAMRIYIKSGAKCPAIAQGGNVQEVEANARLIAAAPETAVQRDQLLAALKQLKAVVEGPHRDLWKSDWVAADAAIAAAEGRPAG